MWLGTAAGHVSSVPSTSVPANSLASGCHAMHAAAAGSACFATTSGACPATSHTTSCLSSAAVATYRPASPPLRCAAACKWRSWRTLVHT
jgi:hypothetical protein